MKYFYLSIICLVLSPISLWANNLQITGVTATASSVTFSIAWDNSWNINNLSRDAAWVFVKYQDCGSANKSWDHLDIAASGHTIGGALLQVDAAADGKGVFIRRSAFGGGNNPSTSVTLAFATGFGDISQVNFDVVGIEMVYVPQASFTAGDGISFRSFGTNMTNVPQDITSEAAIAANGLAYSNDLNWANGNNHPAVPAGFPKGFAAFYCMKYEITQSQYVHFLNLLPAAHQAVRTAQAPGSAAKTYAMHSLSAPWVRRNYIQIKTPAAGGPPLNPAVYGMNRDNDLIFDETNDGGNIACNFLSWQDLLAYLDWSALRPMTELEFEKSCRGPASAGPFTPGMYAWGTTSLVMAWNHTDDPSRILNPGLPNESSTNLGDGLCCFNRNENESGPYRVGFAAGNGTSRQQSGSTYYGIMEMSGNVVEQCMAIGRVHNDGNANFAPQNLPAQFLGTLGDGLLNTDGDANQSTWGAPLNYKESIMRGGGCINGSDQLRVSDRFYLHARTYNDVQNNNRQVWIGGRGVRQF